MHNFYFEKFRKIRVVFCRLGSFSYLCAQRHVFAPLSRNDKTLARLQFTAKCALDSLFWHYIFPMSTFTQTQLAFMEQKARAFLNSTNTYVSRFIGVDEGRAVFGFRLNVAPHCKVGLPTFVAVSPDGNCTKVLDRRERFRLTAKMSD